MATTNIPAEKTYTLLATGPTVENVTVEPATGQLEIVVSEGVPAESLRGHYRVNGRSLSVALLDGEFLYGRSSNEAIVVVT